MDLGPESILTSEWLVCYSSWGSRSERNELELR